MKQEKKIEPKVIYDLGSCVLHWTNKARKVWPNAEYVLFDAFDKAEFLYKDYKYHIGVLSDEDNKQVEFYQHDYLPGGNSYYKEIGSNVSHLLFNDSTKCKRNSFTMDTIVKQKNLPLPELAKIDVQGCEIDILRGMQNTLENCKNLIIELQNTEYNLGAPKANESIPIIESMGYKLITPLFQNNGADGDYHFSKE